MNPEQASDHDLLIAIKTELSIFREESRSVNSDTKERLIKLGENKVEKDAFNTFLASDAAFKNDHELRMRRLETWCLMAIGSLYVINAIIGWYIAYH